jgi:DNA helicase-2/ATP-dependent DNA helicase PcrA
VPAKGKGHFAALVADIGRILAADPERHPADAIDAILQGGYPAHVRTAYEAAENRLADIEQLSVLASRYESLEELVAHLILAGDVYAVDSIEADEPVEQLVLSTIHQAKGLEWSRVFLLRLNEDSFPSVRSLREEAGEEEERRIFYVAVTRAMDELTLTYPQMLTRRGRNETVVAQPSRFVAELDELLYETATIDGDVELAWSSGPPAAESPNRPGRP